MQTLNVNLKKHKIHFIPNVPYAQVPTFDNPATILQMDLLQPQVNHNMPAVIFVTGGGFISANRERMIQLRMRLAEAGYFVASINYRIFPNSLFPSPIEDVKSAIRFIKANAAKINVDPNRISVIGDSAGGYLTAMMAVTNGSKDFNVGANLDQSSKIVAAVDLYGISDLTQIGKDFEFVVEHQNNVAQWNPMNYITKESAPMLLMHGAADSIISPEHTNTLFRALQNAGVESECYIVPNANHADDYWVQDEFLNLIVDFLNRRNGLA